MLNLREMFAAAILSAMVFAIIAIVTGHLPRIGKRCDGRAPAAEPIRNGPPTGRDGLMDLNCRDAFPAGNSLPLDMVGNFLRGRAITPSGGTDRAFQEVPPPCWARSRSTKVPILPR